MALLTTVWLLGQEATGNLLTYGSSLLSIVLAGGIVALVTLRSTARKASADATVAEAGIERADAEIDDLRQKLTAAVLKDVNGQLAQYREQIAEERSRAAAAIQGQANAQAELARVQLQLAEALEQASKERHALRSEVAALGVENANLRNEMEQMRSTHAREVADLRGQIKSLRAQLDTQRHGRRREDGDDH